MKKLVVASGNKGKLKEISAILGEKFDIVSKNDIGYFEEVEENGKTFFENAKIKAQAIYDFCHMPTLADDSGLMVDALGGEPNIYSARYAGPDANDDKNIEKLLKNMQNVQNRKAKFVCTMVLIDKNEFLVGKGETSGEILTERKGTGGFGYDSVFFSPTLNKTFAEATEEEKNQISHRKNALLDLLSQLK